MITLWAKTGGQIKGVSALTTYPLYLVTRDPDVKTHQGLQRQGQDRRSLGQDIDPGDHAADGRGQGFGEKDYAKLDPLTVSLSHPDATLAFWATPPA